MLCISTPMALDIPLQFHHTKYRIAIEMKMLGTIELSLKLTTFPKKMAQLKLTTI